MKTNLSLLLMALIVSMAVAGCASQPDYKRAAEGGYGYTDSQLSDTQYRVHFKAKGTDKSKAMDYAMLRASELTLLASYDWFVVTNRETLIDKETVQAAPVSGFNQRYTRVRSCGLLACRTSYEPTTQFEAGVYVGGVQQSEIETILHIEMGKGPRPTAGASFDAREVKENLMPQTSE